MWKTECSVFIAGLQNQSLKGPWKLSKKKNTLKKATLMIFEDLKDKQKARNMSVLF